jgi:3-oxoacyl-[acyl-carrier-protein] synthase II
VRRVVVTGLGAVTPVGVGVKAYWDGITAGRSGVGPLTLVDPDPIPSKVAGECVDFDPSVALGAKEARRLDRSTQFALSAAREAWQDSEIEGKVDKDETGVVFATGIGGISSLLASEKVLRTKGPDRVSPFTVPQLMPNAAAGQVAMSFGLRGPNFCTTTACAASNHAIGLAFQAIQHGEADAMVAGGSESAFVEIALVAFAQMTALSTRFNDRPREASRPFDSLRDGFVMGEGAGALILEEREHALRRDAYVYAELVGFGQSADAFHITAPSEDGSGAALAMRRALRSAAIPPTEVGYINAHATSTPTGDISEIKAIRLAFGEHADKLAVSATKSMIGHLFGAAGAVEGIATVLTIRDGILPPTINLTNPDPAACDLDLVPDHARKADVEVAMSNGFGFGGHNAVLVFRRHDEQAG